MINVEYVRRESSFIRDVLAGAIDVHTPSVSLSTDSIFASCIKFSPIQAYLTIQKSSTIIHSQLLHIRTTEELCLT